ncbi:hypothetical protein ACHAQA_007757 [Verticillium albo-atrum]
MSASLAPECNEVKERYDTCFLKWYSEKYLRGVGADNNECADLFKSYQKCLTVAIKDRGIDKLVDESREDNRENDAAYMGRKSGYITARWDLVTRLYELAIFAWEYGVVRSELPGVVVGWRNSPLDVFVVAVLDHVDPGHVEFAFKVGTLFRNSPHPVSSIYERCGHASMHVLGLTNAGDDVVLDPFLISAVTVGPKVPQITCAKAVCIQIILYDRPVPSKMQYISLRPISLALGNNSPGAEEVESELEHERLENRKKEEKGKLVEKLKQHIITKRSPSSKEKALPKIVSQVNWAYELERLLQKNVSRIGTRPKRALSVSERVVEHAETMRNYVWDLIVLYLFPVIQWGFVYVLIGHRAMAEVLLRILEWRIRPHYAALKDISATAQQVEIRLQQFCYWPLQYRTLRQRKDNWESVTTSHPDYIRFYNSLWLVANDVIIGIALGSYIIDHSDWVANTIAQLLRTYTVEALRRSISWLMSFPAGLKLNKELGSFLGDLFLWVIEYWSARIFHWQLTILVSLFHLFRGKKQNILRNRIDSCDYDLDQLLVGTILFTLLFFLLPTVVVFYLNFAVARMIPDGYLVSTSNVQ